MAGLPPTAMPVPPVGSALVTTGPVVPTPDVALVIVELGPVLPPSGFASLLQPRVGTANNTSHFKFRFPTLHLHPNE
jgi:hypothetical protein